MACEISGVGIGTFDTKEAEQAIIRYKETGVTNITQREGGSGTVAFDKRQKWRTFIRWEVCGTTFITREAEQALDKYNESDELPPN